MKHSVITMQICSDIFTWKLIKSSNCTVNFWWPFTGCRIHPDSLHYKCGKSQQGMCGSCQRKNVQPAKMKLASVPVNVYKCALPCAGTAAIIQRRQVLSVQLLRFNPCSHRCNLSCVLTDSNRMTSFTPLPTIELIMQWLWKRFEHFFFLISLRLA